MNATRIKNATSGFSSAVLLLRPRTVREISAKLTVPMRGVSECILMITEPVVAESARSALLSATMHTIMLRREGHPAGLTEGSSKGGAREGKRRLSRVVKHQGGGSVGLRGVG